MFRRLTVAVDVTLRSALTRTEEDGAILLQARVDKENKYPELLNGRCRLVVVAGDGRQMEQRGRGLHLAVGPGERA